MTYFNPVYQFGIEKFVAALEETPVKGLIIPDLPKEHEDYIKPQESSARTDTRWAQVTDRQGFGLRFDAIDAPMTFAADPYTSQRCAKARHREELTAGGTTCIHLDQYQLGAGSNACGPVPRHGHTRNTPGNRVFSFSFEPTGERHD